MIRSVHTASALLAMVLAGCGAAPAPPVLPPGKSFALALIDESDKATLASVRPVYEALLAAGFRSTLAVWTHEPRQDLTQEGPFIAARTPGYGVSLEDEAWREFIRQLAVRGFEIASHSASAGDDTRQMMIESFDRHLAWFGRTPRVFTPHHYNLETPLSPRMSWSFPFSLLLTWSVGRVAEGARPNPPHHWADLYARHIRYAKAWSVWDLNTILRAPGMPGQPSTEPSGFACTSGYAPSRLPDLFSVASLDRLAHDGGVAIVCTHFSSFTEKAGTGGYTVRPFGRDLIDWLSHHPDAWVATAGEVLDALAQGPGRHPPTWSEQAGLFADGIRNYLFLNKPKARPYLSTRKSPLSGT